MAKQSFNCNTACFSVVIHLLKFTVPADCTCSSGSAYCPHSTDCEKYYQCVWNIKVPHTCPSDTVWYQRFLTCGHGFKDAPYNCKWSLFRQSFIHSYNTSMWFNYMFNLFLILRKESLNSDGQHFHQYQHN